MKNELQRIDPNPTAPAAAPGFAPRTLAELQSFAQVCADSGFFQDSKGLAQAMVKIAAGAEVGIAPIQAMTSIHVIKGKVSFSANLVAALLRRADAWAEALKKPDEVMHRGKLTLNVDRMTVDWQGQPVDLTVTEFWMLHALVQHPGHVRSRDQLMDAASTVLDDNTVTSHIKRIRRKFQQLDSAFDGI